MYMYSVLFLESIKIFLFKIQQKTEVCTCTVHTFSCKSKAKKYIYLQRMKVHNCDTTTCIQSELLT